VLIKDVFFVDLVSMEQHQALLVDSLNIIHERLERLEGFMDYIKKAKDTIMSSGISFDSVRDMIHSLDKDLVIDRASMCITFAYRSRSYKVCVNESAHRATLYGPSNTYSFDSLSQLKKQIELDSASVANCFYR